MKSTYLVVISTINEELVPGVLINEGANQGPQHAEDPWCPDNQQSSHRLWVVLLHNFNDSQQGLNTCQESSERLLQANLR